MWTKSTSSSASQSGVSNIPSSDTEGGAPDVFARLSIKKKKARFVKFPEDHTPLPDPFPLPAHYREDVERCLKSGSMTQPTKQAFSQLLLVQCLPTRDILLRKTTIVFVAPSLPSIHSWKQMQDLKRYHFLVMYIRKCMHTYCAKVMCWSIYLVVQTWCYW